MRSRAFLRPLTRVLPLATTAVLVASATAQTNAPPVAVRGVSVVDVKTGALQPDQTVLVEDGRITAIGPRGRIPQEAIVVAGEGKFLLPGLWDMHVHVRSSAAPTRLFPLFVAHGVTGVRDMNSDCQNPASGGTCVDDLREWAAAIARQDMLGPRILALSSFSLNPPWDDPLTEDEARATVRRIAERNVDLIKVYYRLSPEALGWILDEARTHGLDVAGHIPIRMTSSDAAKAGLRSIEHARDFLFDCFPGSEAFRRSATSQNPPIDVMRSMVDEHDTARCEDTFRALVRHDTWYVPTHVTRKMDAFADDPTFRDDPRAKYLPQPVWDAWQQDADRMVALDPTPEGRRIVRGFYETGLAITGRAFDAGVGIVLGTDAGDTYSFPGSGVHDELGELVEAGLSPAEALAAATIRAAEFLKLQNEYGSVEVGKKADLVLLNANPLVDIDHVRDIEAVVLGGRVLERDDLDRLLLDVASLPE